MNSDECLKYQGTKLDICYSSVFFNRLVKILFQDPLDFFDKISASLFSCSVDNFLSCISYFSRPRSFVSSWGVFGSGSVDCTQDSRVPRWDKIKALQKPGITVCCTGKLSWCSVTVSRWFKIIIQFLLPRLVRNGNGNGNENENHVRTQKSVLH